MDQTQKKKKKNPPNMNLATLVPNHTRFGQYEGTCMLKIMQGSII